MNWTAIMFGIAAGAFITIGAQIASRLWLIANALDRIARELERRHAQ